MGQFQLSSLNFKLLANIKDFSSKLQNAERQLQRTGKKFKKIGSRLNTNLTLPLVAAGAASAKFAIDFDDSIQKIQNLVGIVGEDLNVLVDGIDGIAKSTSKSKTELAEALFVVTSAGLRGADALGALEQAAKASDVGLGDVASIARATTGVLQAYASEGMTAAKASEILFQTVRAGNLDAESLAPSIGKVLPLASQLGVSFEEVGSNIATFTRLGISAKEAVTAMRSALQSFIKPTEQAKERLAEFGLTSQDLRDKISEDGLAGTMQFLIKATNGNVEALADIVPSVEGLVNVLGTAGSQGDAYNEILSTMNSGTDDLNESFINVTESGGFKLRDSINELKNASIKLGTALIPMIQVLGEKITAFSQYISGLDKSTISWIVTLGAVVAALGPVLSTIGTLITVLPKLGVALTLATGPFGVLIAAVGALGAGMLYLNNRNKEAINIDVTKSIEATKSASEKYREVLGDLNTLKETYNTLSDDERKDALAIIKGKLAITKATLVEAKASQSNAISKAAEVTALELLGMQMGIYASGAAKRVGEVIKNTNPEIENQKNLLIELNNAIIDLEKNGITIPPVITEEEEDIVTPIIPIKPKGEFDLNDFNSELLNELRIAGQQQKLNDALNIDTNLFELKADILKSAIEELFKEGYTLDDDVVQELKQQLLQYQKIINPSQIETDLTLPELPKRPDKLVERPDDYNTLIDDAAEAEAAENALATWSSLGAGVADSMAQMSAAMFQTKEDFLNSIREIIGALLAQTIATLIANAFAGAGPIGLAIAPAIAALGANIGRGLFNSFIPQFAEGGIVSGPTLGLMGEYAGASNNPEVIAPLDKLKSMIGDTGGGTVRVVGETRISGRDLRIVLKNEGLLNTLR